MVEIIKFGAEWCDPCKQQDQILDELSTKRDDVNVRDIDVEEPGNTDLKRRYQLQALPTVVVLDDETPVEQFNGLVQLDDLEATIENVES